MMKSADAENAWGIAGTTPHDAPYPVGGGCHGGLSSFELQNVLTMAGSRFKTGKVLSTPAGNIDILPTILHLLGIEQPKGLDGRALIEVFCDQPDPNPAMAASHLIKAPNGQTQLSVTDFGRQRYLNKAWAT